MVPKPILNGNSIVEVATAVPAFVGYTQKAEYKNGALFNRPLRITSLAEFHEHFCFGPVAANAVRFSLATFPTTARITATAAALAATDVPPLALLAGSVMSELSEQAFCRTVQRALGGRRGGIEFEVVDGLLGRILAGDCAFHKMASPLSMTANDLLNRINTSKVAG